MPRTPQQNHQQLKTVWKSTGNLQKDFTKVTDLQFRVCPFTIILGAINSTETGYKPPTSIPNDYTSFSKIYTGREAILTAWDHSYTAIQDANNPDLAYKKFKVGDVFYGNVVSDQLGISYSATPSNNAFIQEQAIKNVVINIPNEPKNSDFINNIVSNLYKLYMIPEINAIKNDDNSYNVDRQWYILEVATKTYNNDTKELAFVQCTFSSLNDKLSTSGLAINQYVQVSAPADPTAIPSLDIKKNIILDKNYLKPLPVTHCQISFYGSVKVISMALWGRDIDNNADDIHLNKFRQYPTKLLFPWKFQCSTYDPISFQSLPETNYVLTVRGQSVMDSYQDWQQVVAPMYDDQSVKHYEGHLKLDVDKTKNTNQVDDSGRLINFWDDKFLNGSEIEDYVYSTVGNPYFTYYNKITKKYIGNNPSTFNMNLVKFKSFNIINALHYFVYNPITEIPLTSRETIKINLNTIPIFGSFMNFFVGGLNIGAKLTSNLLIPQFAYINGFMSAELFNFYTTILYSSATTNPNLIPLDVFRNETPDAIQSVLGTASHMTSFTFNMTDQMNLVKFNLDDNTSSLATANSTANLSQLNEDTPNTINLLGKNDTSPLLLPPLFDDNKIVKWAIDMIDIKVVGKSNFKLTFYSMPDNRDSAVSDEFAIWSGIYQTVGKASNNSRLIQNTFILSNPQFKFDKPFNFPKAIQPPPLEPKALPINFPMTDPFYWIKNSIQSTLLNSGHDYVNDYQMRPNITEAPVYPITPPNKYYAEAIILDLQKEGYKTFADFKNDYDSVTFNFNLSMSNYSTMTTLTPKTNKKTWFTPIKISLDDIKEIQISKHSFEVNDTHYTGEGGGDHQDNTRFWVFNVTNPIPIGNQTATVKPEGAIASTYVNNLLWTNDNPSSGEKISSSTWFKIIAWYDLILNCIFLNYQFITTFRAISTGASPSGETAEWDLETTSCVFNPKYI